MSASEPGRGKRPSVYLASADGLLAVPVDGTGDPHRLLDVPVTDVAVDGDRLVVATDEAVRVRPAGEGSFRTRGFGPAAAVAIAGDDLVAGSADGRVARYAAGEWKRLGEVGAVRAIEGGLVGAADGVYRITGETLAATGLDDVTDVSAAGQPLVATGEGLYYLGPGWALAREGAFACVTSDGDRAYAGGERTLYERTGEGWEARGTFEAAIVDVAAGGPYVATADGRVFAGRDDPRELTALAGREYRAVAVDVPETGK